MSSKSDADLLQAYLGGELPPDQIGELRARLTAEPGLCEQLLMLAREETILSEWARSASQVENILFDPYHQWLGIQPKNQPPNHYRLLGIEPFEDDSAVIGNAADQRMAHLRSFQSGKHSRESQRLLNEVAAAKICLLSSERKVEYDQELRQQMQANSAKTLQAVEIAAPRPIFSPQIDSPSMPPSLQSSSAQSSHVDQRKLGLAILAGLGVAAAVLLVVTGAYLAINSGGGPPDKQPVATAPQTRPADDKSPSVVPDDVPSEIEPVAGHDAKIPPAALGLNPPSLPSGDTRPQTPRPAGDDPLVSLPAVTKPDAPAADIDPQADLTDTLLDLTLTLSQTEDDLEQMWIYQQMASTLLANMAQADRFDPNDAATNSFLANYVHLVQQGVLPRLAVVRSTDEQGRLRGVAGRLQADCRILETLVARAGNQGQFAEAMSLSNKCRTTAESALAKLN